MDHTEPLDFILVRQKETLINRIDNARSPDQLKQVLFCLTVLTELWQENGYDYKRLELRQRINNKLASFRVKT